MGAGVAGLSMEDSLCDPDEPLLDVHLVVERVAAARSASTTAATGMLLAGRSTGEMKWTARTAPRTCPVVGT